MLQVIDLSEVLHQGTPVVVETIRDIYEDPPFYTEPWASVDEKGYSVHAVHLGTHSGTHIDAPSHFYNGTASIDQIPPTSFVGWAVVINCSGQGAITAAMLKPFKERVEDADTIPVIISNPHEYLSVEAAEELITWQPKALVISCGFNEPDELYTKSRMLLKGSIPLVQRVVLEKALMVNDGDLIVAAPLPLLGMDGAPARVYAIRGLRPG